MAIEFCQLSLSELHALLAMKVLNMVILLGFNWTLLEDIQYLRETLNQFASSMDVVFVLSSKGNDNIEDFAVDILRLSSLPCLLIYERTQESPSFLIDLKQSHNRHLGQTAIGIRDSMTRFLINQRVLPRISVFRDKVSVSKNSFSLPDFLNSINTWKTEQQQPVAPAGPLGTSSHPLVLYVGGDRSSVGKSTVCLALLANLLLDGVAPGDVAYIKPVTQCEAEQPITRFCRKAGISEVSLGPVVFYTGFTRSFLAGELGTSANLVSSAVQAVRAISQGKKFVLVDGVGYPAVGSICGISNADVAKALDAPVLLVGKSGVGDAVDSHNLNAAYFASEGCRVLGAVFNKLSDDPGAYYFLDNCQTAVGRYFDQFRPGQRAYGFLPAIDSNPKANSMDEEQALSPEVPTNGAHGADSTNIKLVQDALASAAPGLNRIVREFRQRVNVHALMLDAWLHQVTLPIASTLRPYLSVSALVLPLQLSRRLAAMEANDIQLPNNSLNRSLASQEASNGQLSNEVFANNGRVDRPLPRDVDSGPHDRLVTKRDLSSAEVFGLLKSPSMSPAKRPRTRGEIESEARSQGASCATGG